MTVTLLPAVERDLNGFAIDPRQASLFQGDAFDMLHRQVTGGTGIAAHFHGRVIGIGGLVQYWPGRAAVWCFLRSDIPKAAWVPLTRAVRAALSALGIRRIEADVRADFWPAQRWAFRLGFVSEGLMRAYWSDGADYLRFARVAA